MRVVSEYYVVDGWIFLNFLSSYITGTLAKFVNENKTPIYLWFPMDGWLDDWVDGWTDGRMDVWMY